MLIKTDHPGCCRHNSGLLNQPFFPPDSAFTPFLKKLDTTATMNDSITFVYIYTCLCIAKLLLLFFGHLFGTLAFWPSASFSAFCFYILIRSALTFSRSACYILPLTTVKSFVWFVGFLFGNSRFGFLLFFFSSSLYYSCR